MGQLKDVHPMSIELSEKRDKSVQGFHLTSGLNKAINQYVNKH